MGRYQNFSREDLIRALHDYEAASTGSEDEKKRLLYDLPLHQIELEIQNRDLCEAQRELEEARDRYAELYDFAPIGYLSLDKSGVIRSLNLTASAMLGKERIHLVGMPLATFLAGESKRHFFDLLRQAFSSGEPLTGDLVLALPPYRDMQLDFQVHDDAGGENTCLTVLGDITEKKRAQETLRRERGFLQNLIDTINDPIMVISPEFKILLTNRAAAEVAKASGLEDACLTCHKMMPHRDRPCVGKKYTCPLMAVLETGKPAKVVHEHATTAGDKRKFEVSIAPLYDEQGKLLGAIEVNRDISEHFALLDELKARELSYAHLAQHDPLTGLPNRVLFADRLSQAIHVANRKNLKISVLFVDLDRFKEVNDSFDHSHGDEILEQVANRLKTLFREDDTVARMGGDEFTVILNDIGRVENAGVVADKILGLLRRPFKLQGQSIYLSASIGISTYPDHGRSVDDLVRNADTAMYKAKGAGGGQFNFYSKTMTDMAIERVALDAALHDALDHDELQLYYQPQIDLESGRICGFEALVRWQRPGVGLVLPDDFIKCAEDTGTIIPVGERVLHQACAQIAKWQQMGLLSPETAVSVNISGKQFDQSNLVDLVAGIAEERHTGGQS